MTRQWQAPPTVIPTKYVLLIENGVTYLRAIVPSFPRGYTNIEAIPRSNPKPAVLAMLRKQGTRMAKRWNVSFEDRTS
jgi:hypothetical protein